MKRILLVLALLAAGPAYAADNAIVLTPGAGVVERSVDTTGAGGPQSPMVVLGSSLGVQIYGTPGAPPAGTNVLTVQGIASMTPVAVSGTLTGITNPIAATQSGTWSVNPTTPANWAIGATAAAVPANAIYHGMNVAGNLVGLTGTGTSLNVNCTAGCAGSGGTSSTYGVTFPTVGTAIGLTNGTTMVAWSATTNYGTAPAAIAVPAVNAFVSNANANGRNTSINSSPVVPSAAPTTLHLIALATTNANFAKASPATLLACQFSNNSTTPAYFKVFNKISAPTLGTDIPVVTLIIPGPAAGGGGSNVEFGPGGLALSTGFAYAVTSLIPDLDATAVAAATFAINCQYD
jgi:hypothetical protein